MEEINNKYYNYECSSSKRIYLVKTGLGAKATVGNKNLSQLQLSTPGKPLTNPRPTQLLPATNPNPTTILKVHILPIRPISVIFRFV